VAAWLGGGLVVVLAIAASVLFAVRHTNGTSGPGDVLPGNVRPLSHVLISDACGSTNDEGVFEPKTIQLRCGDGTVVANGLTWSQWGTATALARGTVNEVSCVPDCASGKDVAYPARLALSEPVRAGNGRQYFTRIVVSFTGRGPGGSSRQLFEDCFYTPPAPFVPKCPAAGRGSP
jgi:hypothetical protein